MCINRTILEDSKIFFTYLPLQPSEQHNWLIERGKDTAPTMILDPSRAGEEVALVGQAADDNGRQLEAIVHHSSVSSAHIAKLDCCQFTLSEGLEMLGI